MQRLFGFAGKVAIDGDEVAGARSFARNNNLVVSQTRFKREFRGLHGGQHHAVVDDFFGFLAEILVGVLLHFQHDQLLIERAAIDADAYRFAVVARDFANGGELFITALACADIAGIDAIFVQRLGAIGIFREQNVAVVMKVADDRNIATSCEKTILDFGDSGSGFRNVDGPAHDFRASFGKFQSLLQSAFNIGGVRVGHGLDDDRSAAADADVSDIYAVSFAARVAGAGGVVACNLVERGHTRHSLANLPGSCGWTGR